MPDNDFERVGKRLFVEHLASGNFDNMSVRERDTGFYIKRTGACLDTLGEPVFVPFSGDVPSDASSEYRVHLAIYRKTPYRAIVHAYPPFAVGASLAMDEIIPLDRVRAKCSARGYRYWPVPQALNTLPTLLPKPSFMPGS